MNFQDVVFCWEEGAFKVCLGPDKHVCITDGFLYTVTTNDLKRNCLNLSRIPTTGELQFRSEVKTVFEELGPGISRISGSAPALVIDKTEELARRLAENRKN